MEEVEEILKNAFARHNLNDRENKIAFAIGYLEDCDKLNRKQAIQILHNIFFERE